MWDYCGDGAAGKMVVPTPAEVAAVAARRPRAEALRAAIDASNRPGSDQGPKDPPFVPRAGGHNEGKRAAARSAAPTAGRAEPTSRGTQRLEPLPASALAARPCTWMQVPSTMPRIHPTAPRASAGRRGSAGSHGHSQHGVQRWNRGATVRQAPWRAGGARLGAPRLASHGSTLANTRWPRAEWQPRSRRRCGASRAAAHSWCLFMCHGYNGLYPFEYSPSALMHAMVSHAGWRVPSRMHAIGRGSKSSPRQQIAFRVSCSTGRGITAITHDARRHKRYSDQPGRASSLSPSRRCSPPTNMNCR
jgi:hypothetical protein